MNTDINGRKAVFVLKCDTTFGSDAGGDFSLPDYMPEIKRLLYVSASVLPEGKFINGGALELGGTLCYNAVYIGDDGSLSSAPIVTEYSADTAISAPSDGVESIMVDTQIESTTCRATGPRNLNIKSRLKFRVTCDEAFEDDDVVTDSDGGAVSDSAGGIERQTEDISSVLRRRGSVTESLTGEMKVPEGAKPIMCDGTLSVVSALPVDGGVRVNGNICIKCVLSLDGDYSVAKSEMPFDVTVPVNAASEFTDGRAWGRVASVNVSPAEGGLLNVSVEYDLDAEVYCSVESTVCTDAYSMDHEAEPEYREYEVPKMVLFGSERIDVSGEAELRNQSSGETILDLSPAVCQASVSASEGKVLSSGSVKIRALINAGGEIYAQEIEMPFKVELGDISDDIPTQDLISSVSCTECNSKAKIADGKIIVDSTVMITFSVCQRQRAKVVTAVLLGEKTERDAVPCIKVYYPERDENVWDICKKYRADRGRLLKNNSFDGEKVSKGKPVIIM